MRLYETGFLLSPQLTEEEAEAVTHQLADIIAQRQGKMVKIDKWGKRRTAYTLKKWNDAYFVFFHYEGGPDIPAELTRRFRQMDTVLRFLTLTKETMLNTRRKKKTQTKSRGRETAETPVIAAENSVIAPVVTAEAKKREEA
jgi:small subunit ribosomal protein S6